MKKYKEGDLIVLQFADNACYTQIKSISDAIDRHNSFSINLDKGTWEYDGKKVEIGKSRDVDKRYNYGVIGVYDRNNNNHLDDMVHASNEAIRPEVSSYFSD